MIALEVTDKERLEALAQALRNTAMIIRSNIADPNQLAMAAKGLENNARILEETLGPSAKDMFAAAIRVGKIAAASYGRPTRVDAIAGPANGYGFIIWEMGANGMLAPIFTMSTDIEVSESMARSLLLQKMGENPAMGGNA